MDSVLRVMCVPCFCRNLKRTAHSLPDKIPAPQEEDMNVQKRETTTPTGTPPGGGYNVYSVS